MITMRKVFILQMKKSEIQKKRILNETTVVMACSFSDK